MAELIARLTGHGCDLSDDYPKRNGPPTCHAGCKEIATGHRLDGDSRLTLQEARNELRLHLLHHTGQTGFTRPH